MKCECGCDTFFAVEVKQSKVIVSAGSGNGLIALPGAALTISAQYEGSFVCTNCKKEYGDVSDSDDSGPLCSCGNNRFFARQEVYYDVVVDGNNIFNRNIGCEDAETPYGPYTCTRCGKEYDDLDELTNNEGP